MRLVVRVANFLVDPNFNFLEITSLRQGSFLGGQVSVVGASRMRSWQWLAVASMLLLIACVIDAAVQSWRTGGLESGRQAAVVGIAIVLPMACNIVLNQMMVSGVLHARIRDDGGSRQRTEIAYELGRECVISRRAQVQLAELRGELAKLVRLSALGQLASGLTHDLRQPLAASMGNAQAAELLLQQASPTLESCVRYWPTSSRTTGAPERSSTECARCSRSAPSKCNPLRLNRRCETFFHWPLLRRLPDK